MPVRSAVSSLARRRDSIVALGFLLPRLVGFLLFFAYPTLRGLALSFTDWDLLTPARFIGVDNDLALFQDGAYWNSLGVTIQYVLWNLPVQTVLAFCPG